MAGESADDLARRQREKAERLMRSAERYERGAEGERRTALLLDELSSYGYVALHDLKWPGRQRANIDHVLVGPSGVYMIDSKNWSGRVVVGQGTVRQNGYRRDQELASCGEAALALVQTLNTDVVPVLCLVRDDEVSGTVQNVHVCTTKNLHRFILSRRAILTMGQIQWVAMALRGELPAATDKPRPRPVQQSPTTPQPKPTPRKVKQRRQSQVRERGGGGLALLLAGALMLGGYAVVRNLDAIKMPALFASPGGAAEQGATSLPFGKQQTLREGAASVTITVGKPANTKPEPDGGFVRDGSRLVSVPVTIRNTTKQKWQPGAAVTWRAEDSLGNRVSPWSAPRDVTAGRRLPAVRAVWPGKPHRGVLVFEVPKGQQLESISLQTSLLGGPDATWSSTGGR